MNKIVLFIVGVLIMLGIPTPAFASPSDQKVCVSINSSSGGVDTIRNQHIGVGSCKTVNRYDMVMVKGASYRVRYNSGGYSECRGNTWTWFDAYNKPDKITFITYNRTGCVTAY